MDCHGSRWIKHSFHQHISWTLLLDMTITPAIHSALLENVFKVVLEGYHRYLFGVKVNSPSRHTLLFTPERDKQPTCGWWHSLGSWLPGHLRQPSRTTLRKTKVCLGQKKMLFNYKVTSLEVALAFGLLTQLLNPIRCISSTTTELLHILVLFWIQLQLATWVVTSVFHFI